MKERHNGFAQQKVKLSFTISNVNKVLAALGNLPYAKVYQLIQDIREQTESQLAKEYPASKQEHLQHERYPEHTEIT